MEKYGVVTDEELLKTASDKRERACPECGTTKVDFSGAVPHCQNCGTRPWESRAKEPKTTGK